MANQVVVLTVLGAKAAVVARSVERINVRYMVLNLMDVLRFADNCKYVVERCNTQFIIEHSRIESRKRRRCGQGGIKGEGTVSTVGPPHKNLTSLPLKTQLPLSETAK